MRAGGRVMGSRGGRAWRAAAWQIASYRHLPASTACRAFPQTMLLQPPRQRKMNCQD